jgi:hypothetical protein
MTERWHLNGFNMSEVIVIRDGPDQQGRRYVDGRHQISIAKFDTVEQAREFCDEHNAMLGDVGSARSGS